MPVIEELEAAGEVLSPAVRAAILTLETRLAAAEARIRELEARLGLNSTNSSLPPSRDPPGTPRLKKEPTGRRRGGQPGHKGVWRAPVPLERLDEVVVHRPEQCRHCGASLEGAPEGQEALRHQVIEVPEVRAWVREHRRLSLRCPCCGKESRAPLPAGVGGSVFGPRLAALVATCTVRLRLSRRAMKQLFEDLLDLPAPSVGSIQHLLEEASRALLPAYREVREAVRQSERIGMDETTWWLRGMKRWLWVAVTTAAVCFRLATSRAAREVDALLGKGNCSFLSTDRYAVYELYPPEMRQICWAHLLRDFKGLILRGGAAESFGRRAKAEADGLFHAWHRLKAGEITRDELRSLMVPVQKGLARLLEEGQVSEDKKVRALARSLTKLWPALWTFLYEEMEPTNNAAERALRHSVLWRKNCFGSNSGQGLRLTERLLTVAETARLQQKDLLAFMTETITAHRTGQAPPKLLATG